MKLITITTDINYNRVDVSIWGNTYADRFNVRRDQILAEDFGGDGEVSEEALNALEEEVFAQIDNEEGGWYEQFSELAEEAGFSEVCVVGKY